AAHFRCVPSSERSKIEHNNPLHCASIRRMIFVSTSCRGASRKIILSASSTASLDRVSTGMVDLLGAWPGWDAKIRTSSIIALSSHASKSIAQTQTPTHPTICRGDMIFENTQTPPCHLGTELKEFDGTG